MYSYDERRVAIKLYIKYNFNVNAVVKELGYPSRRILYKWYKEYIEKDGIPDIHTKRSVYSDEQKKVAIEHYQNHGRTLSNTIRALGYPSQITLRSWIDEVSQVSTKRCDVNKYLIRYSDETKKEAVFNLCERDGIAEDVCKSYNIPRSTLYRWKREMFTKEKIGSMSKENKKSVCPSKNSLTSEKDELTLQVEKLKKEVQRLQLEKDILEKTGALLKKDVSINPDLLNNKEKAILVNALKNKYRINVLLNILNMAKSSYFYHANKFSKTEKYSEVRKNIVRIFNESRNTYGYRRIYAILKREGIILSEKVIRRIMREELLVAQLVKKRKYNSYKGEISPAVENIIERDFKAELPNQKWLTDITMFHIPSGKVYLSPIIDCFDGMVVSWSVGTSPNAKLVNDMLDEATTTLLNNETPIVHSDRGGHYRWPGWISRMDKAKLHRSMSAKGCSPDNAACEGFFGRLKNEMYYNRSWWNVTIDDFIIKINDYINWYNNKRIKISLGALSPMEYRAKLGLIG